MKIKILQSIITIALIFSLVSCGNSGNGSNSSDQQSISLPKKMAIEFPKLLQKSEERTQEDYISLKEQLKSLEQSKESFKIDMLLAEQLMSDINKRCEDIPIGTTCTIDENQLYFTYNAKIIEEIIKIKGEVYREFIAPLKDKKIPLGKVEFTQYSESKTYQYSLTIEYVPQVKETSFSKERLKWSKDEKQISSFYSFKNLQLTADIEIEFIEKEDKREEMKAINNISYTINGNTQKNHMEFNLTKRGDANETFDFSITFNSSSPLNTTVNVQNHSIGLFSNQGGTLLDTETNGNDIFKERETFDANGKILTTKYCSNQSSCNMEDESTWDEEDDDGESHDIFGETPPPLVE